MFLAEFQEVLAVASVEEAAGVGAVGALQQGAGEDDKMDAEEKEADDGAEEEEEVDAPAKPERHPRRDDRRHK